MGRGLRRRDTHQKAQYIASCDLGIPRVSGDGLTGPNFDTFNDENRALQSFDLDLACVRSKSPIVIIGGTVSVLLLRIRTLNSFCPDCGASRFLVHVSW